MRAQPHKKMLTRARSPRLLLALASLVALTFPPVLMETAAQAADTKPTGNAKAIAFYREMVKTVAGEGGVTEYRSGYAFVKVTCMASGGAAVSLDWSRAKAPAGYSPVTEFLATAFRGGKSVWTTDQFTPTSGVVTHNCDPKTPLRLLLNSKGGFLQVLTIGKASTCWQTFNAALLWKIGGPEYETFGHFYPMQKVGKNEIVDSSFTWTKTTQATEIDTISRVTHLPSSSVLHIPKVGTSPAYVDSWSSSWLKKAPAAPQVTMCL